MLFNASTEETMIGFLEAHSLANEGLSKSMFLDCIRKVNKSLSGERLNGWYNRFIQRHKERLSIKTVQAMKPSKNHQNMEAEVNKFISWIQRWFENNNIDKFNPKNLFNCDETRLSFTLDKYDVKVIESNKKPFHTYEIDEKVKYATYLPFHNHNGIFYQVLVLPTQTDFEIEKKPYSLRGGPNNMFYLFTHNGWLNKQSWNVIIKHFRQIYDKKTCSKSNPIYLLLDQLKIHRTFESLKRMKRRTSALDAFQEGQLTSFNPLIRVYLHA